MEKALTRQESSSSSPEENSENTVHHRGDLPTVSISRTVAVKKNGPGVWGQIQSAVSHKDLLLAPPPRSHDSQESEERFHSIHCKGSQLWAFGAPVLDTKPAHHALSTSQPPGHLLVQRLEQNQRLHLQLPASDSHVQQSENGCFSICTMIEQLVLRPSASSLPTLAAQ